MPHLNGIEVVRRCPGLPVRVLVLTILARQYVLQLVAPVLPATGQDIAPRN
jgi:hypothetical protein